ncbi:hypothetical protein [Paraburkholderia sp. BL10I2N1]|uniref:hypothetical protein n=1 Tax=Paraburkholderia sp. BL10I2N1 TaxID=1938796 RepID=UPI001061BA12|nr:hypothetical protein [Paraburkholderia sp. BL10I2N1]
MAEPSRYPTFDETRGCFADHALPLDQLIDNLPGWHRLLPSLSIHQERLFSENFSDIAHAMASDTIIDLPDCTSLLAGEPLLLFANGLGGFSDAALFER